LLCTPLCSYSPAAVGKSGHLRSKYLDWVVQREKESHRVVAVSCVGYEEHFMAFGQLLKQAILKWCRVPFLNLEVKAVES
jgi:hypothetical protein